jgi:uncharacterized Zn finger protein
MYERAPYRPCPMCRTQLEDYTQKVILDEGQGRWKCYECPNCGSAVFIDPFIRVKEGKMG